MRIGAECCHDPHGNRSLGQPVHKIGVTGNDEQYVAKVIPTKEKGPREPGKKLSIARAAVKLPD